MKTIDELIEAQKRCATYPNCHFCFLHAGPLCTWIRDTLEYLKAYQKIEDEYDELKDWWAEEHAENVPLSWKEMKCMVGKPVWLVYDWNNVHYEGWILLDHLEGIFIIDAKDEWALSEVNMDNWNNWKAYRKEKNKL